MPRQAKPWYRTQTDSWYVEHRGQQHNLGKHPDAAPPPKKTRTGWNAPPDILQAFHRLEADGPAVPVSAVPVAQVCDLFLDYSQKHNDDRTFKWYRAYLQDFCHRHGRMPARELVEFHVDRWLDSHPHWTTSRRNAVIAVKRAFNWADRKGVLRPNPIRGVEKPPSASSARTMTKDERKEILAAIQDWQFRLFVEAMQESGARPSEVARLTAADVNLELGACVLHRHKTGKKTGKPRVIYLTPRLTEILQERMREFPQGPLFRGPRLGKPFGMHGICARFRRLREKLPHLKNAIAYAYRYSFASEALTNGVGIA